MEVFDAARAAEGIQEQRRVFNEALEIAADNLWSINLSAPAPQVVIGPAGPAGMIRVMRANLLDELRKPCVATARAKGVRPLRLLFMLIDPRIRMCKG